MRMCDLVQLEIEIQVFGFFLKADEEMPVF